MPVTPKQLAAALAIKLAVCQHYGLGEEQLLDGRRQAVAHARIMAMALTREMTMLGLKVIGELYRRDHTSVMHASKRHKGWLDVYKAYREDVAKVVALAKKQIGEQ